MRFIGSLIEKLQRHPKRIVFPEGTEPRILQAARDVLNRAEEVIAANQEAIRQAVKDIATFSASLARNFSTSSSTPSLLIVKPCAAAPVLEGGPSAGTRSARLDSFQSPFAIRAASRTRSKLPSADLADRP